MGISTEEPTPADLELLELARGASRRAHAPYSRFAVGAAVRTLAGGVYTGCNVENASYGLAVCAERSAIFAAVAAEGPDMRVGAVAVHAEARSVPPCGACRQVIAEFGPDARVVFPSGGAPVAMSLGDLLPERFELDAGPG
jgi:cytidine deaminase